MEFKGTSGTWYVDESNPTVIWHPTIIGEQIASLPNLIQLEGAEHGFLAKYSKDEALANAQLIASAPLLLEVLIEVSKHHQGGHSEIGFKIRQAIEKATKI